MEINNASVRDALFEETQVYMMQRTMYSEGDRERKWTGMWILAERKVMQSPTLLHRDHHADLNSMDVVLHPAVPA